MLGRIIGKATTLSFSFELMSGSEVKKFDYLKVLHRVYSWVLCQAVEIETSRERTLVRCQIIGYKNKHNKVKQIRIPLDVGVEVFLADDEFIKEIIELDSEASGYIGLLEGSLIQVKLDLSKVLTKHLAVLAKSGAGKSYAVGVLIEEILERKIPVLVIDPHGEYGLLREPAEENEEMVRFQIKPKGYLVREYGEPGGTLTPLRLPNKLSSQELVHLIPGKMNNTQLGVLYSAMKGMTNPTLESLMLSLEQEESSAKWSIINILDHLRRLGIFSSAPIAYNELIKSGVCSVINMRGIAPEIQQVIVYKLAKDLFELRKQNKVPPFFLVVEEAHNYCPERSFGEATSSKILRTIASEGRKFGLGLCVISQRPARVDKSVLSQCSTQIILKVSNPNDLKAIGSSVEGLTAESESEIQNLVVGTALVTGVVDTPLFVNIRPRRTKHGGRSVNILDQPSEQFLEQAEKFEERALLPVIKPKTSPKDLALMSERDVDSVITCLIPAYLFTCKENEKQFNILVDMTNGEVVMDLEEYRTSKLPDLSSLSQIQVKLLSVANTIKQFTKEEIIQKTKTTLDIDDDLKTLLNDGYLKFVDGGVEKDGVEKDVAEQGEVEKSEGDEGKYLVTDRYVLSRLSTCATYSVIEYESIKYSSKDEPKVNLDDVKESLGRFTKVLDQQECNIVKYEVVVVEDIRK